MAHETENPDQDRELTMKNGRPTRADEDEDEDDED